MSNSIDFFISYANDGDDPEWAQWIAHTLEVEGYVCRIQAWDFGVGANFVVGMDEHLRSAERLLLVLSPAYFGDRPMVKAEWSAKFIEDADGRGRLLIPVMVRECDVRGLLGPRVYVSLVGKTKDEAKEALLKAVAAGRAKPSSVSFPGGA